MPGMNDPLLPHNAQGPGLLFAPPRQPGLSADEFTVPAAVVEEPINILIVDDEPKNLVVLETLLDAPHYRLVRATSADQALLALVAEEFALLILDIRMPGMTGFELAQIIKTRKKTAQVPIIFLTAYYNEDQHVLEGYGSGAVDYLHKPVNAAVLRSKVAIFAQLHRKSREVAWTNQALRAEISDRRRAEEQLRELNEVLDLRVAQRTDALSASDARLRLATDTVGLGIWIWQPGDDAWVWENDWLFDMLGISRNEGPTSAAQFAATFVHRQDRPLFERAINNTLHQGAALQLELRLQRPDGMLCWAEFAGNKVMEPDGSQRVLGTVRDTTQRQRAEQELRDSEARYRALFHSIDEGFCVADMLFDATGAAVDFRFAECNLAFGKHSGLVAATGKCMRELVPDFERSWLEAFGRVASSGEAFRQMGEIKSLHRFLEIHAFRLGATGSGKVAILLRDITERSKAEEALRERERFLSTVTAAARIGLAVVEPGDVYRFANDAYAQMLQLAPGAMVGQPVFNSLPDIWAGARAPLQHAFNGARESFEFALPGRAQDDRLRHFGVFLEPHIDIHGLHTVAVVVIEITDLKQLESELRDTDRRKDEFLATLAHELRNPLAPVRNAVHMLHLKDSSAAQLQWAREVIDRQVKVMTRLIDDLMDVSRINQGRIELRREAVPLAKVLAWAIEASRPQIEEYGHQLALHLPADEPLMLDADVTRLSQVFMNLLTNAAKYTDRSGRIDVTVRREGDDAVVTVKDNGIGIATDKLRSVFVMFSQVEDALSRSRGGLGIGLSLAKRLVEMHGGRVKARSTGLGQGSEFEVVLPLALDPTPPEAPAAMPGRQAPEPIPANASAAPAPVRVLVIDDNRDGADSLTALLSLLGYAVQTGYDGEAAVSLALEFAPNIVLLDIGLPKISGYEACKRIRAQPGGQHMALVAMTGWGDEEAQRKGKEAGFDRHLIKPVDEALLMSTLAELSKSPAPAA